MRLNLPSSLLLFPIPNLCELPLIIHFALLHFCIPFLIICPGHITSTEAHYFAVQLLLVKSSVCDDAWVFGSLDEQNKPSSKW
jgi:hypothetical protein